MIYWLYEHRDLFSAQDGIIYKLLNVFRYHTFRAGGAAVTAFAAQVYPAPVDPSTRTS